MPNIELEKAIQIASEDKFWAIRAKAIQSYANLEQALANLFACLGGMDAEVAGTIFFKISSADSRNKIVAALYRKKFDDQFNLFRNSLFDQLRPLDQERNEVVHWNAACKVGHDGKETTAVVVLTPANILGGPKPPQVKDTDQIEAFGVKAQFYARLTNMFTLVACAQTDLPEADKKTWLDIFSRPIAYPPPLDHPLFPKPGAPETHIQAFLL